MKGARGTFVAVLGAALAGGLWIASGLLSSGAAHAQDDQPYMPPVQDETAQQPGVPPIAILPPPEEPEPPEEPLPEEVPEPIPTPQPPPPATPNLNRAFGTAPSGAAGGRITVKDNLVNLDFADADIQDVVKQISEMTGKNFILDERVRGKITIISPTPVSIEEAYNVFLSALAVKGFTTVPTGKFIKVIPLREAKESNIETLPGRAPVPSRDEYITRLIPLRYVDATEITNSLKPLASRDASMIPYAPTNTIILSDTALNINKILDIIRQIDVSTYQPQLEIIVLKYAAAKDIAEEISQVFGDQGQPGTPGVGLRRFRQMGTPG